MEEEDKQPLGEEKGRWVDFLSHCDEELADTLFGAFAENRH